MQEMLELFETDAEIKMHVDTDEICSACPNNRDGICVSDDHVKKYDQAVLELCGLADGMEMTFLEFAEKIQKEIIIQGRRAAICGSCQWNHICSVQKSRWDKLAQAE